MNVRLASVVRVSLIGWPSFAHYPIGCRNPQWLAVDTLAATYPMMSGSLAIAILLDRDGANPLKTQLTLVGGVAIVGTACSASHWGVYDSATNWRSRLADGLDVRWLSEQVTVANRMPTDADFWCRQMASDLGC